MPRKYCFLFFSLSLFSPFLIFCHVFVSLSQLIADEVERELLFEQVALEHERRQRAADAELKQSAAKEYEALLRKYVHPDTTWRRFREQFADDPRFVATDRRDRIQMFLDHRARVEKQETVC